MAAFPGESPERAATRRDLLPVAATVAHTPPCGQGVYPRPRRQPQPLGQNVPILNLYDKTRASARSVGHNRLNLCDKRGGCDAQTRSTFMTTYIQLCAGALSDRYRAQFGQHRGFIAPACPRRQRSWHRRFPTYAQRLCCPPPLADRVTRAGGHTPLNATPTHLSARLSSHPVGQRFAAVT